MSSTILERLRELIPHGRLSEVARKGGMSRTHLAQRLAGSRSFTYDAAIKLSAALEGAVSVESLVGGVPAGVRFWEAEFPPAPADDEQVDSDSEDSAA